MARCSSAVSAGDAFDGYGRAVRGCPTRTVVEGPTEAAVTHELIGTSGSGTDRTALFLRTSTCQERSPGYGYYAVQQLDDAVSVLVVGQGEDGDPGVAVVQPFADVVAATLQAAVRG